MNTEHPIVKKTAHAWCLFLAFTGTMQLNAQNTCADLTILSVQYAAFNDSVIEVVAQASEGSFFSYPQFSLVDTGNDTLTHEDVNFFGIGQGPQTHSSVLRDGQTLPASPFEGTLVFSYSGPEEENFCTFPLSGSLCPPTPCVDMEVFVYRQATPPLLTTSFTWSISDEAGGTVGSGALEIDAATGQLALDDLCLPPGHYLLYVQQDDAIGTQFNFGVGQRNFTVAGPTAILLTGGEGDLPFTLHRQCFATGNGIPDQSTSAPTLALDGRTLIISNANGKPLGSIEILDATGRCVRRGTTMSSFTTFDLGDLAHGMHIVRTADISSTWKAQRIILH